MSEKKLKSRKHPRLNDCDYAQNGAYFVTICTQNRRCILSRIVGRGLAPAEVNSENPYVVEYTEYGRIAEQQIYELTERYSFLTIDNYVIMPNHIHIIFIIDNEAAGASPRPTIMDIVCTFKSLTTKECKRLFNIEKMFQTSFYEHIVRNRHDYDEITKYIYENPMRWHYDELYAEE